MAVQVYWAAKTLAQMTRDEWESLCDGCGKCCLHKLEDEDTGDVFYTDVACRLLDDQHCRCQHYDDRQALVPDCLVLQPGDMEDVTWLPLTCAYRLLAEGESLPDWHPLVSGDPDSVHAAGMSVAGRTAPENQVPQDQLEEHIIHWVY